MAVVDQGVTEEGAATGERREVRAARAVPKEDWVGGRAATAARAGQVDTEAS